MFHTLLGALFLLTVFTILLMPVREGA